MVLEGRQIPCKVDVVEGVDVAQERRDVSREQPNINTSRGMALPVKKLLTPLTGEDRLRHAPRDTANPEHKHGGF